MLNISYASEMGNMMHVQVCATHDIATAIRMVGDTKITQTLTIGELQRRLYGIYKKLETIKTDHLEGVGYSALEI